MKNPIRSVLLLIVLLLISSSAYAVVGVKVEGIDPAAVQSGTLTFPGQAPQPIVTKKECNQQGEDCPEGFVLFLLSEGDAADRRIEDLW